MTTQLPTWWAKLATLAELRRQVDPTAKLARKAARYIGRGTRGLRKQDAMWSVNGSGELEGYLPGLTRADLAVILDRWAKVLNGAVVGHETWCEAVGVYAGQSVVIFGKYE